VPSTSGTQLGPKTKLWYNVNKHWQTASGVIAANYLSTETL